MLGGNYCVWLIIYIYRVTNLILFQMLYQAPNVLHWELEIKSIVDDNKIATLIYSHLITDQ